MDARVKEKFIRLWQKYFNGAELPITFYYANEARGIKVVRPPSEQHRCIFADLSKVRAGKSLCFDANSIGCLGGKRHLGFTQEIMPDFEYFLSCGIPGKLEGERYKKTPELVKKIMQQIPQFKAPGKFIIFKRWDTLEGSDEPDVLIFFTQPDVLSGLFTLANFDIAQTDGVFSPFAAGCGSIVQYPYLEKKSDSPRAVLGLFDVSARPHIPEHVLSFSVPMNKFAAMIENMEESFLITGSWSKVHKRIEASKEQTSGTHLAR
jgi:uncharacterized protein (DUF169 family)